MSINLDGLVALIPFLIPLVLLQLGLMLFAVIDIAKKSKTKTLSPLLWIIIVLCVNMIGPILYIIFGRAENKYDDDNDI